LLEELATEAEPGRSHDVTEQYQSVPDVSAENCKALLIGCPVRSETTLKMTMMSSSPTHKEPNMWANTGKVLRVM
jgi:hypothetical protein